MSISFKLIGKLIAGLSAVGLIVALSIQSGMSAKDVNVETPGRNKKGDRRKIVQQEAAPGRTMTSVIGIKLPPDTSGVSSTEETTGGLKKTIVKLESWASPDDLQIFFTDQLLEDWMIMRDDLTPHVGWSGVFLQIEPIDRNLGIFAVVHKMGIPSGRNNPTRITIMAGQAVK